MIVLCYVLVYLFSSDLCLIRGFRSVVQRLPQLPRGHRIVSYAFVVLSFHIFESISSNSSDARCKVDQQ